MAKQTATWQEKFEEFFVKLPALPKNWQQILVKVTPFFALVFGILGVLGGLAGLGMLTVFSPFLVGTGVSNAGGTFLGMLAALVASALLLAAFPGTRVKKMQGWNMLFWSEVASFLSALLSYSFVGGVIGAFIGFYLLYQIKSYYK